MPQLPPYVEAKPPILVRAWVRGFLVDAVVQGWRGDRVSITWKGERGRTSGGCRRRTSNGVDRLSYRQHMRDSYRTGQLLDLGSLPNGWRVVDLRYQEVLAAQSRPTGRDITARKIDEASNSGTRVYLGAARHLGVAMDNHRALQGLLEHHGATLYAPWNLLRPVMEASFCALWALEPATSLERRQRAVRLEVSDHVERGRYLAEFGKAPNPVGREVREKLAAQQAESGKLYRQMADGVGLTWSASRQKVNTVDELTRLRPATRSGALVPPYLLIATWRSLSGFQHGYGYPMMHNSEIREEVPVPGGVTVNAVIDDESFVRSGYVVAWMLWEACELFVRRCTRPD